MSLGQARGRKFELVSFGAEGAHRARKVTMSSIYVEMVGGRDAPNFWVNGAYPAERHSDWYLLGEH